MKLLLLAVVDLVFGGRNKLIDFTPIVIESDPNFNPIQDIFYLLFTRSNPIKPQIISFDLQTIANSNFRRKAGTRFLIHGWIGSANSTENFFTRDELLDYADFNVIVVDWSVGAGDINYFAVINRVGPAGKAVAQFIDFLSAYGFVKHSQVNIIGISLGAHVAGHAGKNVRNGRINAIFATDPAGPLFDIKKPENRLDFSDAEYTEAIHTNAGELGFVEPITHASFYPNWGSLQPGCGAILDSRCSHLRASYLYSESIRSSNFRARQCAGYHEIVAKKCSGTGVIAIMGGDRRKRIRGVFFLKTNKASPFAKRT